MWWQNAVFKKKHKHESCFPCHKKNVQITLPILLESCSNLLLRLRLRTSREQMAKTLSSLLITAWGSETWSHSAITWNIMLIGISYLPLFFQGKKSFIFNNNKYFILFGLSLHTELEDAKAADTSLSVAFWGCAISNPNFFPSGLCCRADLLRILH